MSKIGHYDFRCPKCGHRQGFTIWESVTAHLNPELKSNILDGTIFLHRCGGCNSPIELTHSILYNDTALHLACWLVVGDVDDALQDAMDSFGMIVPDYERLRIVYTLEELAEKIVIFEAGLNDWYVLMMKIYLAGKYKLSVADLIFTGVDRSGEFLYRVDTPQGKRGLSISGAHNAKLVCSQWDELEEMFDWIHTSEANYYKVYSIFSDRFPID